MSGTGALVLWTLLGVVGTAMAVVAWCRPRPSLRRTVQRLHARPAVTLADPSDVVPSSFDRVGSQLVTLFPIDEWLAPHRMLRLLGRSPARHVGLLAVSSLGGFLAPPLVLSMLRVLGLASIGWMVPLGSSIVGAVVAPAMVHLSARARAEQVAVDLRHQLSAYLDMVTMLLAGNTGHEAALEQAARAGDGLLFRSLRRRMREVSATGTSLVGALSMVADDFDLVELRQVAATTALSAAEGAPVARTLAAKCSTLRSTLAADQEAAARVRNDKVTPPLVGMALLFMALIIYPALDLT